MIIIALGSNLSGVWGTPKHTLHRALKELRASGIQILGTSKIYYTRAHSHDAQPNYLNAVVAIETPMSANALLQVLKRIEALAGRRQSKSAPNPYTRWKSRTLDVDIVDYKGLVCNWKMKRPIPKMRLVLPHPRAHERAFVMEPIRDLAPRWRHPVHRLSAATFLKRPSVKVTGKILNAEPFER